MKFIPYLLSFILVFLLAGCEKEEISPVPEMEEPQVELPSYGYGILGNAFIGVYPIGASEIEFTNEAGKKTTWNVLVEEFAADSVRGVFTQTDKPKNTFYLAGNDSGGIGPLFSTLFFGVRLEDVVNQSNRLKSLPYCCGVFSVQSNIALGRSEAGSGYTPYESRYGFDVRNNINAVMDTLRLTQADGANPDIFQKLVLIGGEGLVEFEDEDGVHWKLHE